MSAIGTPFDLAAGIGGAVTGTQSGRPTAMGAVGTVIGTAARARIGAIQVGAHYQTVQAAQAARMFLALLRKNPVVRMSSSSSSWGTAR